MDRTCAKHGIAYDWYCGACVTNPEAPSPDRLAIAVAALERIGGYSQVNGMTRRKMRSIANAALSEIGADNDPCT